MGPLEGADKYFDSPNPYYQEVIEHDTYDAFWKARSIGDHLKNVHCAVLAVGGLFDAEDIAGPMRTYHNVAKFNPGTPDKLVEGPWPDGGWTRPGSDHLGDVDFHSDTAAYFRVHIQFPFFEHYLRGKGDDLPNAIIFETGTNVWRTYDAWPPKSVQPRKIYLRAGGRLSFDPPGRTREGTSTSAIRPTRCPLSTIPPTGCRSATWSTTSVSPRAARTSSPTSRSPWRTT